ncbi:MAG TPA: cupin domain-containing protein [Nitriliruptoraceae bacterium]|nr:cupin domain-containing protein [Nitriliruptoraceae bacterium]
MTMDEVQVVSARALVREDGSSDVVRSHAVDDPGLWAGVSTIDVGVETGWHHHGSNTTVFQMVSGSLRVEFGDPVRASEAGPGDFVIVPPRTPHREIVTGDEVVEAVVIRFGDGEGPLTVELEGPGG